MVALAAGDIAILSATAQALGHPGLDADVAGLLDLAPTEQTLLLIARLTGRRPRWNRALTTAEEAVYTHTLDRIRRMWSLGCALPWRPC